MFKVELATARKLKKVPSGSLGGAQPPTVVCEKWKLSRNKFGAQEEVY